MRSSFPWSIASLTAVLLSWLAASAGTPFVFGATMLRAVGSFFFGTLLPPLGVPMAMAGEASGVQACGPEAVIPVGTIGPA